MVQRAAAEAIAKSEPSFSGVLPGTSGDDEYDSSQLSRQSSTIEENDRAGTPDGEPMGPRTSRCQSCLGSLGPEAIPRNPKLATISAKAEYQSNGDKSGPVCRNSMKSNVGGGSGGLGSEPAQQTRVFGVMTNGIRLNGDAESSDKKERVRASKPEFKRLDELYVSLWWRAAGWC